MSFQEVMGYQNNSHFTSFVLWQFLFFIFLFFFIFSKTHCLKKWRKVTFFFSFLTFQLWLRLDNFLRFSAFATFRESCLLLYFRFLLLFFLADHPQEKKLKGTDSYLDKKASSCLNVFITFSYPLTSPNMPVIYSKPLFWSIVRLKTSLDSSWKSALPTYCWRSPSPWV